MIDFIEYVIGELKSKRLSKANALALIEQFSRHSAAANAARLHPLLHRNTSDLIQQSYVSVFSGEEFFLSDHQVNGQKMLPAVAYLEMVRAAMAHALPRQEKATLELRNLVWAQPVVVGERKEVAISLYVNEQERRDDRIDFEIHSSGSRGAEINSAAGPENRDATAAGIVHCQGQAIFSDEPAPAPCDLRKLRAQMVKGQWETAEVYSAIAQVGIRIGPSHQSVKTIYRGEQQQLVHICLPDVVHATSAEYVLHPSILDSMIQAATSLVVDFSQHANHPPVPFALDCLRIFSTCQTEMFSWARYAAGSGPGGRVAKLDIDLCDADGNVCVRMLGFSSRVLGVEAGATSQGADSSGGIGRLLAAPEWQPCTAGAVSSMGAGIYAERHVVLCGVPNVDAKQIEATSCLYVDVAGQTVAAGYTKLALASFEKIQAMLVRKLAGRTLFQVVIADDSADHSATTLMGLTGLLKSAAREHPQFVGQLIVTKPQIAVRELAEQLREARNRPHESSIKYHQGKPHVVRWQVIEPSQSAHAESKVVFRDRGVYVITGGLGGLGRLFAGEILRQTRDARVIVTGRSVLSADKRSVLDELTAGSGQRVFYRPLDLGDPQDVKRCIASVVEEFGQLNGILHSAGMISDAFILKKTPDEFARVLEPKVAGTFYLDQACQEVDLDFFVLFSAGAAVFGNTGQADYAAANGFMDGFAEYRNRLVQLNDRRGLTVSINWPLWQDGGMSPDAASRKAMQRDTGMVPMQTETGLEAFYRSLHLQRHQVLVVQGELERIRRALLPEQETHAAQLAPVAPNNAASMPDAAVLAEQTRSYLRKQFAAVLKLPSHKIDPLAPLEKYGIDSILAMELTGQLERTFGSLPKTLLFEYQTLHELADYFIRSYFTKLASLFSVPATESAAAKAASALPQASSKALLPSSSRSSLTSISERRFRRQHNGAGAMAAPAICAEPIAIVGLSGRYPEAYNVEEYWQNLRDGKDCIVEIPKERWDWREYYSEGRSEAGRHYSKWGGFIKGVDEFDPLFFNISPADAELIDPQERLFLQHAWMALEDAGYTRARLQLAHEKDQAGQVGVYVGVMYGEYQLFGAEASLRGKRMGLPISYASIANRVSYFLNLHGPSMAVDTMCSSSLTAIHLACQDLKRGLTSVAIAGGVNVTIHPNKYLLLSSEQFISSDGRCQSFGEGGDGYIPGEGVGVVILKRLADALKDGNLIYGVIKGSALNHGGKTNGYSVPNPQAQASVISRALSEYGIEPRHISYVEAHGTGTKLGDPIEIAALTQVFRKNTPANQFCLIGSAKSNIGHCESAAGIAGLTKVLLQMKHGLIVPSLHSAELNPHIDFVSTPFLVNQTLRKWVAPEVDGRQLPKLAGLSSFGAGGSNAHLVVEEYVAGDSAPAQFALPSLQHQVLIALSARTAAQLNQRALDLLAYIRMQERTIDLTSVAYTLQVGREAMEERFGLLVNSVEQLAERLQAYVDGEQDIEDACHGQVKRNKEALSLFSTDTDLQCTVDKWITDRKLAKLLELWVKGLDIDWSKLHGEDPPRFISLPTYPFAKERYWIDAAANAPLIEATAAMLHPLLHTNTSDFNRQSYRSTFSGKEFFLADHKVAMEQGAGQKVLPGVAYLEMARAAIAQALPGQSDSGTLELRNIVWVQPLIVADSKQVDVALTANGAEQIDFEIYSQDDATDVLHCQGRATFGVRSPAAKLDIKQLEAQMTRASLSPDSVYAAYNQMGLEYGPAHRAITTIALGEQQLLATMSVPAVVEASLTHYLLHPSLLDGALQAAIGLLELSSDTLAQARLPFALESLRVAAACTSEMLAWVRYAPGGGPHDKLAKLDIDLCDSDGHVCVQMRGLSSRALSRASTGAGAPERNIGSLLFQPVWQDREVAISGASQREYTEHHIILCELPGVDPRQLEDLVSGSQCLQLQARPQKTLPERYSDHALACFEKLRILLDSRLQGRVLVQIVVADSQDRAVFAGLAGLLRTAALENVQLVGQVILTPSHTTAQALARQLHDDENSADTLIRYQQGVRQVLHWQEMPASTEPADVAFRDDGVYLITGALGGLGVLFAREILACTKNAKLVLTGRSALDARKQAMLDKFSAPPGRLEYRELDLGNQEQVRQFIAAIKERHTRLDGILHSAGMVADNFILKKSPAEFSRVLAPKVTGTFNLDMATQDTALDFFVLFSSVSGAMGNAGQADYAAANGFMDQFAAYRNKLVDRKKRRGRTLSINWPLWLEGGMKIDPASQKLLQQATGMQPLHTANGIQALYRSLQSQLGQTLVVEGDLAQLRRVIADQAARQETGAATVASAHVTSERAAISAPEEGRTEVDRWAEKVQDYLRKQFSTLLKLPSHKIDPGAALEVYGIESVLAMKLTSQLEKTFGPLSKTLFFEYQTIAALARYLLKTFPEAMRREVGAGADLPKTLAVAKGLDRKRQAALSIRGRNRFFDVAVQARREVAIVGLGGRYPQADNLQQFWENLKAGRDCVTEIPQDRWNHELYFDADRNKAGKSYSRWGGFIADVDKFDPLFFNISPKEAEIIDPQERLFLETAWQTLEDAGYSKESLSGKRVGVFVGAMWGQYELFGAASLAARNPVVPTSSHASIANRVSYFFDFHGPSIALDTMCSSSLTAIHLACEAIRRGEIESALAGGVNLSLHPQKYLGLSQGKFASSDGRCRSFGQGGDGYVPGEGVGAVFLKPLEDALRDGDQVYAVIKSSTINHGGKTNGYTVPNPNAQGDLILEALHKAGIDPRTLGYIETHGTGTSLGDPIEITGLLRAFEGFTQDKQFCPIGSVKSNIGHLESAAGIAAITKALLQIRHEQLVPSLHAEPLNANIHFEDSPFYVQTETAAWTRPPQYPRRVAVSSFGAGGSNGHLILEEYVDGARAPERLPPPLPEVFVLSAKDQAALGRYAAKMAGFLEQSSGESLMDIAYTSQVGRTPMPVRLAVIASSVAELSDKLHLWVASQTDADRESAMLRVSQLGGIFQGNANDTQYSAGNLISGAAGHAFLEDLLTNRDLAKAARLWTLGAEVDWSISYKETRPRRVTLPTYPFLKERYWVDTEMLAPSSYPAVTNDVALRAEEKRRTHYQPQWQHRPLAALEEIHESRGPILLLDTADNFFPALKARLAESQADHPIVLARLGRSYQEAAPDLFTLDHAREEDFQRLMETLRATGRFPRVILHRYSGASTFDDKAQMAEGLSQGVYTLLHVCKAWMKQKQQVSLRVLSFFSSQDQAAAPLGIGLGGFCRTLTLENPRIAAKVIELQAEGSGSAVSLTQEAQLLWSEIRDRHWSTGEIRYRCSFPPQGARFTRHIKEYVLYRPTERRATELPLKQRGVYIITGGLGGLGFIFAAHLAKNFGARLVLVGRSALDEVQAEKLERLKRLGGEVLYVRGDVAKSTDAKAIVRAAKAQFTHINGVIHSAGVNQDCFVLKKTREEMDAVLDPKVYGTVNLDRATSREQLDLFVLFSSVAAVLGNLGQCDYAYGNHFLDAFAETREQLRAAGKRSGRTLSINWPFWEEGGMTLSADDVALTTKRTGMQPLPTAEGIQYWEDFLRSPLLQGVALYGSPSRIAAYIAPTAEPADKVHPAAIKVDDPASLLAQTENYLKRVIGAEIKLTADRIDSLARFESLGIESVAISRCNAQLESDLGALPKTLLYEYETIRELAGYLLQEARHVLVALFQGVSAATELPRLVEEVRVEEIREGGVDTPVHAGNGRDSLEPIAIIGVHGYYPRCNDLREYWERLKRGEDLVGLVPADRWNWEDLYDQDPQAAELGKIYCKWGGFLENYDRFDAGFFNIAPEEARVIDPQERLFLESAWAAIEDAGYTRDRLKEKFPKGRGVDAGVFVGVTTNSYHLLAAQERLLGNNASPAALPWSIANRLSYFLDFKGPSLPVDTACSSSLVALHLACESLRSRECRIAVAGGVNLYLHPSKYLSLCQRRMLAVGGRCRSYGAGDDGFVPGEGVGALVLKRLSEAVADRDHIYAVVSASGFNHAGRANGYSAPNPNAQASLVAATLDKARIHPESVGYVEGHGTGTQLGDSIEVAALTQAFGTRATQKQFCALGSVKANVGHSESAAGIAGVTKVLLQMKHGYLVPSLYSTETNPNIEFEKSPFRLQRELTAWEGSPTHPRRALVNSFGAGGVNACVVLEEYRQPTAAEASRASPPCLFTLSAKTEDRLHDYAQRLLDFLRNEPDVDLAGICYTLQIGREAMQTRLAAVVADGQDLIRRLEAWIECNPGADICSGQVSLQGGPRRSSKSQSATDAQSLRRLAASWVAGEDVDWESLYGQIRPNCLPLPTYPFARERHWISDARATAQLLTASSTTQLHPLVACNASTLKEVCFNSWLPHEAFYAVDHQVRDEPIFPGAAFLEIACLCGRLAAERRVCRMSDIVWIRPLSFKGGAQSLRTYLKHIGDSVEFAITSLDEDNERVLHCEGRLLFEAGPTLADPPLAIDAFKAHSAQRRDGAHYYAEFAKYGLHYGPAFQTLQEVHVDGQRALSRLKIADALQADFGQFILHPSIIDGALQTVAALVDSAEPGVPCLPFALDEVEIVRPPAHSCFAYVEVATSEVANRAGVRQFNIQLLNERGETSVRLKHLHVRAQGKVHAVQLPSVTG